MAGTMLYSCDRCGKTISENRSTFRIETGPMLTRFGGRQVDLCPGCCGQFSDWLKAGKVTEENPVKTTGTSEIPAGQMTNIALRSEEKKKGLQG